MNISQSNKIKISIFHLNGILLEMAEIINNINSLEKRKQLPKELIIPLYKYLLIRSCVFWDELEHQFLKEELHSKNTYIKLKKISDFLIKIRNKHFPDLKNLRNNVLCHNLRIKSKGYSSVFESQNSYTFPKSPAETVFNFKIMDTIFSFIKLIYQYEEYDYKSELIIPLENENSTGIDNNNFQEIINYIEFEAGKILIE